MACDYCYQPVDTETMAVPNSRLDAKRQVQVEMIQRQVCQKCTRRYLLAVPRDPGDIANAADKEKAMSGARRPLQKSDREKR